MEAPSVEIDIVSKVPLEVAYIILNQLTPDDIPNAWNCCKKWRKIMNSNYFWQKKCDGDDYPEKEEPFRSKIYHNFLKISYHHWQGVYQYNQTLNNNWKNHNFRKSISVSDDFYSGICYFDDKILIATTMNMTHKIKIINSSTGKVEKVFLENEDEVVNVFKSADLIVSWSVDRLKVWNTRSGLCVFDMTLKNGQTVIDVAVSKNLIAFGLSASIFRIVNIDTGVIECEHKDEGSNVSCIAFHDDVVGIGKDDGTIKIIELNNYSLTTLDELCERNVVHKIMMKGKYLMGFFRNGMVRIWNLETKLVMHTFEVHSNAEAKFLGKNKFVCRGTGETAVQVWNFVTGTCCFSIDNEDPVKFVTSNSFYILTGSVNNRFVKMWCSRTGAFVTNLPLEVHSSSFYTPLITDTKLAYIGYYKNKKQSGKILHILDYEKC